MSNHRLSILSFDPNGRTSVVIHGANCECHTVQHSSATQVLVGACVGDAFGSCITHTSLSWREGRALRIVNELTHGLDVLIQELRGM